MEPNTEKYYVVRRGEWCIIKGTIKNVSKHRVYDNPAENDFRKYKYQNVYRIECKEGFFATDAFTVSRRNEYDFYFEPIEISEATYNALKVSAQKIMKQMELFDNSCKVLFDSKQTPTAIVTGFSKMTVNIKNS